MQFAASRLSLGQRPPSCLLHGAWRCANGGSSSGSASGRRAPGPRRAHNAAAAAGASAVDQQRAPPPAKSSSSSSSNSSSKTPPTTSTADATTDLSVTAAEPPCPHWGVYGSLPPPPASLPSWDAARFGSPPSASSPALDPRRRIYCNRSLNMRSVRAVGFDLDYTLASYRPETFEALAHAQTVDKLVSCFGYPPSLRSLGFEWRYMTRGLIMDKRRGNILKADRHKYVKIAYHGFAELSRDARSATYNASPVRAEFDEPHYGVVDTLFSLAEAYLFMQLVELVDRDPRALRHANPEAAAAGRDAPGGYSALYRDVRAAVDLCHRDGSLKREVAADPARYIHADPHLVPMLRMLKRSGRRVFLATNSLWDYTNVVMNYLVGDELAGGGGGGGGGGGDDDYDDDDDDGEAGVEGGAGSAGAAEWGGPGSSSSSAAEGDGAAAASAAAAAAAAAAASGDAQPQPQPQQQLQQQKEEEEEEEKKKRKKKTKKKRSTSWLRLFDVVVVGCAKPGFFSERRPIFAVNPRDGTLRNTDNGAPITPIGEDEDPSGATAERAASAAGTAAAAERCARAPDDAEAPVFQGGNYTDLHRLLGVRSGAEVLYVGDHIYGDILRSKKTLGWRTMLVVPELEAELARLRETADAMRELRLLRAARAELDDRVQRLEWAFDAGEVDALGSAGAERAHASALADLRAQRDAVRAEHSALLRAHHEAFHPVWGQLLKASYQSSRFAHQMDRHACLYSAHAANLAFYSPEANHRGKCDALAHELGAWDEGDCWGAAEAEGVGGEEDGGGGGSNGDGGGGGRARR